MRSSCVARRLVVSGRELVVLLVVSGRVLVVSGRALVVRGSSTGRKWSCHCFEVSRGHANA